MKRNSILIIAAWLMSIFLFSCREDTYDFPEVEDGVVDVSATVVFSPITGTLDTRTSGNAIKDINSLCVLIYDISGNRIKSFMVPTESIVQDGNDKSPGDAVGDNEHQAESKTPKATFTIPGLKSEKYYMYAVANMGNIVEDGKFDTSTTEKLRDIVLTWDEKNIASNNQMFGYFTLADKATSQGFNAPLITINRANNNIHAWVKRAASKVTVAIDGSGLNEGVEVWIKSIQIKDIPKHCWLGKDNTPAEKDLIADGEKFVISDKEGKEGALVTKSSPFCYYGMEGKGELATAHSETAQALFFYENMQGEGQSKKQVWPNQEDKTKPMYPNGNDPFDKGFKDSKRAGSYIEVIGYYKGKIKKNGVYENTEGPIIYRFMLGKDIDKNYDAQRNYHYKLTMKLIGNANDADWHIVYEPEPNIKVPNPYYISYLYDQSMNLPIKIMGKRIISLRADIIENGWHAINVKEGESPYPYWTGTVDNEGPWNGFLSLRKTTAVRFGLWPFEAGMKDSVNQEGNQNKFAPGQALTYSTNKTYYEDNKRGWREYDVSEGKHTEADGDYMVSTNGAGEWTVTIPLYTRAAVMVSQTGYTGNNPYVAYRREAKVTFTAVVEGYDGEQYTVKCGPDGNQEAVTIYQMRRVVNPKGIWRKASSVETFHVKMMVQEGESATEFTPLKSEGPWLAVIKNGGDWFDIVPTDGKSQKNPDGTISGIGDMYAENNEGRIVDFTFRPKSATTEDKPRGGLIKIYYNNYTCIHIIFVRQGYGPVAFPNSTTKWHSFNMKTATEEVDDPVLEGSYFRRFNTGLPIAASNNNSSMYSLQNGVVIWKNNNNYDFQIAGQSGTKKWSQITTSNTKWPESFTINGNNGKKCRLAVEKDFTDITSNPNTIYGYGVLYTDGTTETQTEVAKMYGAREGSTTDRGMRGVFVCDSTKGTQIFLPIGATGYGRFKQKANGAYNRQANGYEGVNQYANRYEPMPTSGPSVSNNIYGVTYKPLFWDLYRRPGALYWLNNGNALDINYDTFAFDLTTQANVGLIWSKNSDPSGSDAVFLRLVED